MTQITQEQMIKKAEKNVQGRMAFLEKAKKGSFDERGQRARLEVASALLAALKAGRRATTQEVVAYFGKGARLAE